MRINQYIAKCGICSRRKADELIRSGAVEIDGRCALLGDEVADDSVVTVSGKKIGLKSDTVVIAYYKPVGVTCSEFDEHAERIVTDDIKLDLDRRVTYAGRLDKDSEGLLILTDDGELIDAMMRGSKKHEKEYEVSVDRDLSRDEIGQFAAGIYIKELDTTTRSCSIKKSGDRTYNIVLTQGLNRQIRRMFAYFGVKVIALKRTRVMNIRLGNLQVGASRFLSSEEKNELYMECGLHR